MDSSAAPGPTPRPVPRSLRVGLRHGSRLPVQSLPKPAGRDMSLADALILSGLLASRLFCHAGQPLTVPLIIAASGDEHDRDCERGAVRAKANDSLRGDEERIADLNRQLSSLRQQQDRLLN